LEVLDALADSRHQGFVPTIIGWGCNTLISDHGLPGTTVVWRQGSLEFHGNLAIADGGANWDHLIAESVARGLWGLEMTSEVPGTVAGAIVGNIAAYGQQVSDCLEWVEIFNTRTGQTSVCPAASLSFAYRWSSLQASSGLVVLRAAFRLSDTETVPLKYETALGVAREGGMNPSNLQERRQVIVEARRRAGAIYRPGVPGLDRTAGSFFKNPLVESELAERLAAFDQSGRTAEAVRQQSIIHGGSALRASAAHVLLGAGFYRGQRWGHVRLHEDHVLKLQTMQGATARDVADVSDLIRATVLEKFKIDLQPEVRFLGSF